MITAEVVPSMSAESIAATPASQREAADSGGEGGSPQTFHGIEIQPENPEELFELLSILGKGTFGTVFKARNKATNEIVAIKQILLVNDEEIEVVRKEVKILHECFHPNVVHYKGTYRSLSALWISMTYCAGGSVDGVFKILKRPLTEQLIGYVCREVLKGLVYLHGQHKIHRDIKGGNILLTENGEVKLADFGVSTELLNTMSRRNSFIGTLYWMAPEAIQEKEYDERADLWSLGITVIEVAESAAPRMEMPYARALFAIPREAPPQLRNKDKWSPFLHKFLSRLLVKEPTMRPTAAEMLDDPFVSPERIGTTADLKEVVQELILKAESMTTARRLGEVSTSSSATFVERDRGGSTASNASSGGGSSIAQGDVVSPGGAGQAGVADNDVFQHPSYFYDGSLVQLPMLSVNDLSYDELLLAHTSFPQGAAVSAAHQNPRGSDGVLKRPSGGGDVHNRNSSGQVSSQQHPVAPSSGRASSTYASAADAAQEVGGASSGAGVTNRDHVDEKALREEEEDQSIMQITRTLEMCHLANAVQCGAASSMVMTPSISAGISQQSSPSSPITPQQYYANILQASSGLLPNHAALSLSASSPQASNAARRKAEKYGSIAKSILQI